MTKDVEASLNNKEKIYNWIETDTYYSLCAVNFIVIDSAHGVCLESCKIAVRDINILFRCFTCKRTDYKLNAMYFQHTISVPDTKGTHLTSNERCGEHTTWLYLYQHAWIYCGQNLN